ncbi:hypothetical protein CLOLEP_03784 [[Clostridium] leptum DSM 753]|uniref:Uncharacterized protein n=1 Tax=[Clostridium] leptum DSM 753 TaxID=428125 RepID=A7VYV6_9FIRM|nr:hypothetical protein CLOLEP_03784 [[Clostridium] leptum DSM 753]
MDSGAGVPADGQTAVHNELTGAKQKLRDGSIASIPEFFYGKGNRRLVRTIEDARESCFSSRNTNCGFYYDERQAFDSVFCCSCFLPRRPFPAV